MKTTYMETQARGLGVRQYLCNWLKRAEQLLFLCSPFSCSRETSFQGSDMFTHTLMSFG